MYFYLDEWRNHISHCKCYHVGAHIDIAIKVIGQVKFG